MPAPDVSTLIELLEYRARHSPARMAFEFGGNSVTYEALWRHVNRFAAHLVSLQAARGDRVAILMPNGPDFFFAFYGAQRAGAIPVPLYPELGPERIVSYAGQCGARIIFLGAGLDDERAGKLRQACSDGELVVTVPEDVVVSDCNIAFPDISSSDTAFIQYTSGSTGDPKGVVISHDNLLTNIRQMVEAMRITTEDIFVSWLPVHHDMGLILKTMVPFYLGLDLHLLETDLNHTSAWLKAIEAHKATFTASPDFGYRLCLRQIRDPSRFDLTSLRMAVNAAEPVRRTTIEAFERAFGLRNVVTPAYGLAEATVGVSCWPPGRPIKTDSHGNVSAGRPFNGISVAIVENGEPAETGLVGEIAVKSTALPHGYFDNDTANQALFWRSDHILTGDLGYIDEEGDLFIAGRKKNIIILSGRTIYSREVEEIADGVPPVRRAAAVGIDRKRLEGEQIYVFAEMRPSAVGTTEKREATVRSIVGAIFRQLGVRPGRVYLVKPRTIPLTDNGKVRHAHLRQAYLDGTLVGEGRILFPDY